MQIDKIFHTVQDLRDDTYIKLREHIGAREEFFTGINFLTLMFNFQSFDKMIEFILISRQTDENIDISLILCDVDIVVG